MFSLAPEHPRAHSNREYYMDLLRARAPNGSAENSDLTIVPAVIKNENLKINNQRPKDYLDEREAYEQLCRQTEAKVKTNLNANNDQIEFFYLVKSQTSSKTILSLSSQ